MKSAFLLLRISLCIIFLTPHVLPAQYYDSLNFVNARWKVKKISKGTRLYTNHFNTKNLFSSNQFISYVVVKKGRSDFAIAAEPEILKKVSEFAVANNALAAINGNFFDVKNGGAVDYTKVKNTVININKTSNTKIPAAHQRAAVIIERGKPQIVKWDGFVNWEENLKSPDIMLNGPLLILNKVNENINQSESFNITRHPRTAFGITKRGKIVMLVADGRNRNASGLSLFELTKIMRWIGCTNAINFDGGGSSTLWIDKQGVINHPSDNAKWDHDGERKVANILFLRKRKNR